MGFVDLLVVALMPVLKVLLVTAVGLFIAIEKINLLGPEARNYLNKLEFYLFNPALLVSNLAGTITYKSVVTLWFMPLNIILTYLIGSVLGWILIKITKTPRHLRGVVIGCCSAGNLGNLLLIIVPAVCDESDSPFADSSTCSTDAEAYASLSMAVAAICTWSYVYFVVSAYAIKSTEHNSTQSSERPLESSSGSYSEALLTSSYGQISEEGSTKVELPVTNLGERKKESFMGKIVQCVKSITSKINLKKVFAPSTIAAIVGFVIGIISPVRKVLIGDSAPLHVIYSSAALIGEAAIPSMTMIMGANLLKGLKRSEMNVFAILGVIAVRNIFLPLVGLALLKLHTTLAWLDQIPYINLFL
ncbi:hypothetical protein PTKIN_Ptkin16aG0084000 [Pterospermum kingtungense]